jgi:proline iminopeptidase
MEYNKKYADPTSGNPLYFPFINFPSFEISALKKKLDKGLHISTHRVDKEYGKYRLGYYYCHPDLGVLRVVSVTDLVDIMHSPVYKSHFSKWTKKQQGELLKYGYMRTEYLILQGINKKEFKKLGIYEEDLELNKGRSYLFDGVEDIPDKLLEVPDVKQHCEKIAKNGYLTIDSARIYYEEEGEGTPIIILNSGPGNSHDEYHPYLSRLAKTHRVIYYDARGIGRSTKDKTGKTYTLTQALKDVESLRSFLKIDKWVVFGWSFGGGFAQLYAKTFLDKVVKLILVAPFSGWISRPKRRFYQSFLTEHENRALRKLRNEHTVKELGWTQYFLNYDYLGGWRLQDFYKSSIEKFTKNLKYEVDILYRKQMSQKLRRAKLDGAFKEFKIPTLILLGWYDIYDGGWEMEEIMKEEHPNAKIVMFYRSNHDIFASEPTKFFKLVNEFL